jgi:hypothetical protein
VRIQRLRPKLSAVRLAVAAGVLAFAAVPAIAAPPSAVLRLDLQAQTLGGKPILGQTPRAVVAALGRPTSRTASLRRARFAYGHEGDWAAIVLFRRERGALRSWSVVLGDRRLREPALGLPLRLPPLRLQDRLVSEFGMRVVKPYRCRAFCRGDVEIPGTGVRIGFGRERGEPPYLVLYEYG